MGAAMSAESHPAPSEQEGATKQLDPYRGATYVVTAYRWGQRNAHSYVVGAYPTSDAAIAGAKAHVDYRGGKYGCEVVRCGPWEDDHDDWSGQQIAYVECPYYGLAGDAGHFHPAHAGKKRMPGRPPLTIRELQNELADGERRATAQQSRIAALEGALREARNDVLESIKIAKVFKDKDELSYYEALLAKYHPALLPKEAS